MESYQKIQQKYNKEVNGDNQVTVKGEVEKIKAKYTTEARYIKAIQHLTEQGLIKNDMSDLKRLFPEVQKDLIAEEAENIKNGLYKAFIKDIERGCTSGLVEFYKKRLQA